MGDLIALGIFLVICIVGWIVYQYTEKRVVCQECGEIIQGHCKVENCPVCGSMLEHKTRKKRFRKIH